MFFSKLLYPVFAVVSVATFALASPVAVPVPVGSADLAKRQTVDLLSELQGFQSTVTPLFNQLGEAISSGSDTGPIVNKITTVFNDSTNNLKSIKAADILPGLDLSSIVAIVVSIITTLVTLLSGLPFLGGLSSTLDSLITAWIAALSALLPGLLSSVGSALPLGSLPLAGLLQLLNLVSLLGILGPILSILF